MIVLLILAILLLCAAVALVFRPMAPAAVPAWAGFLLLSLTPYGAAIEGSALWFWGIAAAVVLGIWYMLPAQITRSATGMGFVGGGALAGAFVGLIGSVAAMILASCLGAFFGALAFSRTCKGAALAFPSRQFLNWLCAKGLPAVVTMCIIGLSVAALLVNSQN